jgi:hypothetical protein
MRRKLFLNVPLMAGLLCANAYLMRAQACDKCCGRLDIYGYGHRSCSGNSSPTCHVTDCAYYTVIPNGSCCWNQLESWVDLCASDNGWNCQMAQYHYCVPS